MKKASILMVVFFLCAFCGGQEVFAQASGIGKLDISAIKSMQLRSEGNQYKADVVLLLRNGGEQSVKLKNADFEIEFKLDNKMLPFGKAPIEEITLPEAKDAQNPSVTEATLAVDVGPKNEETMARLIDLFNVLGNPQASPIMVLKGATEAGTKVEKGWVYQSGVKMELEFTPSIQREVLFK